MAYNTKTLLERFHDGYIPEPTIGCWLWEKGVNHGGYGALSKNGIMYGAHRISYELHYGEVPSDLYVCHRCDMPLCVNPEHLFLGTAEENNHDAIRKGRNAKGETHGRTVLSDSEVEEIRTATGYQWEIAEKYGISRSHVAGIRLGTKRK